MILIVDDDPVNCFVLQKLLENNNIKSIVASNGLIAIDKLEVYSEIEYVLLDLNMPVLNGYEFIKISQNEHKIKKLPFKIIILTTESREVFYKDLKMMNIETDKIIGFLNKPIKIDKLLNLVN
jgi:CheY-like chemotaxis protein